MHQNNISSSRSVSHCCVLYEKGQLWQQICRLSVYHVFKTRIFTHFSTESLSWRDMYVFRQIEVMHDYQGNRSCLYGPNPETDSEAEDNPEQVTRYSLKC